MAATYSVVPAELNIVCLKGDEFGASFDFSIDVTGYTWTAEVFETERVVNSQFPGGLNTQGDTAASFAVSVTDAAAGQLNIALTETQTGNLSESTLYRWFLRGVAPGTVTRTYASGSFAVRSP